MALVKRFGGDAQLWRADTTTVGETNFTRVQGVKDITAQGGEATLFDSTNRDDLLSSRQQIQTPGLISALSIRFGVAWDADEAQLIAMLADAEAVPPAERDWQIRVAGQTNRAKFRGFQLYIPPSYPMNSDVMAQTGIQLSGRITYAP